MTAFFVDVFIHGQSGWYIEIFMLYHVEATASCEQDRKVGPNDKRAVSGGCLWVNGSTLLTAHVVTWICVESLFDAIVTLL